MNDFVYLSREDIEDYLRRTKPTIDDPATYAIVKRRTAALDELDKRNMIGNQDINKTKNGGKESWKKF